MKTVQKDSQIENIKQIVYAYLELFPEEVKKLELMQDLLRNADENVRNRKNLPGHLTSGAFILDEQNRSILLIQHNFLQKWLQPGGHMETMEHPEQTAYREILEEVGDLKVSLHPWHEKWGIPIDLDSHAIPESIQKSEPAHYHHDFRYVFICADSANLKLQEKEVSAAKWVSLQELQSGEYEESLSRVARKIEQIILKHPI